jgi:hypothetical protein
MINNLIELSFLKSNDIDPKPIYFKYYIKIVVGTPERKYIFVFFFFKLTRSRSVFSCFLVSLPLINNIYV